MTASTSFSQCLVRMRSASSAHFFRVSCFRFSRRKSSASFAVTLTAGSLGPGFEGSVEAEVEASSEAEEIATTCACLVTCFLCVLVWVFVLLFVVLLSLFDGDTVVLRSFFGRTFFSQRD